MAKYFEAVRPFLMIHPKLNTDFIPTKYILNCKTWQEGKALELVFGLSGVAYIGMLKALELNNEGLCRNLVKLPKRTTTERKQLMESAIEARRLGISNLFPKEAAQAEGINPDLTLVGLIGLGLMRIISPDGGGEAKMKHDVISILFQDDKFALVIKEKYPHSFDGLDSLEELVREENIIELGKRDLRILYDKYNL